MPRVYYCTKNTYLLHYFRRIWMQSIETKTNKKTITIIGTGGTIAGTGEEGVTSSYTSAQIEVDQLVSGIPGLDSLANLKSENLFSVDSCDMSWDNLMTLANYINDAAKNENTDGFVITHGTDTLEETAYFLNLTVKTDKPVVITGSMRPSTAISPDGPFNLYQAVALAADDESVGKGVLIAFSDEIYGARDICKINTFRTDAFSHKDFGAFGYMRDNKVFFYNESTKKHTLNTEFDISEIKNLPKVEILMFYVDAGLDLLKYVSENCDGVVLAGAGSGGSSIQWDNEIEKLLKSGIPVVRASRISNGLITHEDSEVGSRGIYSGNLSPQKARILLALGMTKTKDLSELQRMFNVY